MATIALVPRVCRSGGRARTLGATWREAPVHTVELSACEIGRHAVVGFVDVFGDAVEQHGDRRVAVGDVVFAAG